MTIITHIIVQCGPFEWNFQFCFSLLLALAGPGWSRSESYGTGSGSYGSRTGTGRDREQHTSPMQISSACVSYGLATAQCHCWLPVSYPPASPFSIFLKLIAATVSLSRHLLHAPLHIACNNSLAHLQVSPVFAACTPCRLQGCKNRAALFAGCRS